ncbi:TetR family transcriptional regulator C-terminal domain-containing protein, partial [Kribbella sp.]
LDGLALHAAIQPERTTPTRVRQLMRQHVESLLE